MWIVESFLCCMANLSNQIQLYCGKCKKFGSDRHILVGANKGLKYKTQPYMCLYWTYLSLTELIASICITGKWCVCASVCLFCTMSLFRSFLYLIFANVSLISCIRDLAYVFSLCATFFCVSTCLQGRFVDFLSANVCSFMFLWRVSLYRKTVAGQ